MHSFAATASEVRDVRLTANLSAGETSLTTLSINFESQSHSNEFGCIAITFVGDQALRDFAARITEAINEYYKEAKHD